MCFRRVYASLLFSSSLHLDALYARNILVYILHAPPQMPMEALEYRSCTCSLLRDTQSCKDLLFLYFFAQRPLELSHFYRIFLEVHEVHRVPVLFQFFAFLSHTRRKFGVTLLSRHL